MAEITLAEWCTRHDIPDRTAQGWAKTKKLRATKKKVKITVTHVRTVRTYVIDEKTPVPGEGKRK